MTENESSLTTAMMLLAATKAGDYCRDRGYPPPTAEQTAEMSQLWRKAFTEYVVAFNAELARHERLDHEPTQAELEIAEAVVEGVAQGAVLSVLGQPPGSEGSQN